MGSALVSACVTIAALLNFDSDFDVDANADVTCELGLKSYERIITRSPNKRTRDDLNKNRPFNRYNFKQ